jgi:hypothetical protein
MVVENIAVTLTDEVLGGSNAAHLWKRRVTSARMLSDVVQFVLGGTLRGFWHA